jgi:hypothetical protein
VIEAWQEHCVPAWKEIEVRDGAPLGVDLTLEARPPNGNIAWDAKPGDATFKDYEGKPIEVSGYLDLKVEATITAGRKAVILRAGKKSALCLLAADDEKVILGLSSGADVTLRGIFKGSGGSESFNFTLDDCRLSEAPGQKLWK